MSLYLVSQQQEKQSNNPSIIIPAENEQKGQPAGVCRGNRFYEMEVIILETEARFRGSASGIGAEHV